MYLTHHPIDLASLLSIVEAPEHGGIACFIGRVRDHHGGLAVLRLEYDAYEPMAEVECARIVAEAARNWPVAVALQHRVGPLTIGDVAVAVVAASAHREEAFAACRHVIEEVKRRVPVWKKEFYADGSVAWVAPTAGEPAAIEVRS